MPSHEITVCIPTIIPRQDMLLRAVGSVMAQSYPATAIAIREDNNRTGAAATRQAALDSVTTEWVAFLDDDDVLLPDHLHKLTQAQLQSGADYLFPWYQIIDVNGNKVPDSVLGHLGKPFNPTYPHQTTITTLVRTELAKYVGFLRDAGQAQIHGQRAGEDFAFTLGCVAAGASIIHVPHITWEWHHHGLNTSGLPDRW